MEPYKLSIKFPDGSEFSAEGPEAIVKDAFEHFLEARKQQPATQERALPTKPGEQDHLPPDGSAGRATITPQLLERCYLVQGENVSLRALPTTDRREADVLLLLLYGFRTLKNQFDVTSARLAIGARQSGIQADRVDRIIPGRSQYVTRAGVKKGTRYGLNNPGIRYAEELLLKLFE